MLALSCLILRIPEIIVLLGAGGSGKSESIKLLYRKYQEHILIVAPTGILAGTYNANTYFTTLKISMQG
jgi:alpha-D-ribose 1-methylphosphonate 5-triphosphate synthase subunit PhnL